MTRHPDFAWRRRCAATSCMLTMLLFPAGCRPTKAPGPPAATAEVPTAASRARPGTVPTADDDDAAALREAKRLFFEAVAGDAAALGASSAILERLQADGVRGGADPAQVAGYLGAARLLSVPRAQGLLEMNRRTREGIALMDGAVAGAPADLELRGLRGLSYYNMPGFIGRGRVAAADLAAVARDAPAAALDGRLDPRLAAAVLYHHGLIRQRRRDAPGAAAAFRQAVAADPAAPGARAAAASLARMTDRRNTQGAGETTDMRR